MKDYKNRGKRYKPSGYKICDHEWIVEQVQGVFPLSLYKKRVCEKCGRKQYMAGYMNEVFNTNIDPRKWVDV